MKRKNPPRIKDLKLNLRIVTKLPNSTATEVAKDLGMKKSALTHHLNKLKILDVIEYVGYGTWKVNDENVPKIYESYEKQVQKRNSYGEPKNGGLSKKSLNISNSDEVRSHAFQFVLELPKISNWNENSRRKILQKKKIDYEIREHNKAECLFVFGSRVWLTNKSLVIWLYDSFIVDDPDLGYRYAVYEFLRRVRKIESMMKVSFRKQGKHKFKVRRQHHALTRNDLAEQYNKEKKKLYVFDERGLWLLVDNSNPFGETTGLNELEGVANRGIQGQESRDDINHTKKVFNEFKETRATPKLILQMINENARQMSYYAENIVRHVEVMGKIEQAITFQTDILSEMRDVLRKKKRKGV